MSEQSAWNNRIVGQGMEAPDQLLANPLNFRTHPKYQQDTLKGAIEEIGLIQQVVVNKTTGHMIDGHLRVELAMRENIPEIPVLYVELTEAEEKIALATLDPIGALAVTDEAMLQDLLSGISTDNDLLQAFLDDLAGAEDEPEAGLTDEDDVPGAPAVPISNTGDIWDLGDHVVMCGSTTSQADVNQLMGDDTADMVWTDPPYNVDYEGGSGPKTKIENDKMDNQRFRTFLLDSFTTMISQTKEGGCIYIAHADSEGRNFYNAMEDAGWMMKQGLVWVKNRAVLNRRDYNSHHEPILYGWKPGAAHYFAGDFTLTTLIDEIEDPSEMSKADLLEFVEEVKQHLQTSVIRIDRENKCDLHPTMKPVSLVRRCVVSSAKQGEIVLDGFGGSGTTLIACQTVRRQARIMELDPVFCDVIIKRWQDFTGQDAIRREDGVPFNEVSQIAA